jgi:hypothetical protein
MTASVGTYVTEEMETEEKMLATARRKQNYGRQQQQQPKTSEIPATARTGKRSREQTTAKMPEMNANGSKSINMTAIAKPL